MRSLLLVGIVTTFMAVACSPDNDSGVSKKRYNSMVKKYNSLLTSSQGLQKSSEQLSAALVLNDTVFQVFVLSVEKFMSVPTDANYRAVEKRYQDGLKTIAASETRLIAELNHQLNNGKQVYEKGARQSSTRTSKLALEKANNQLLGIRAEHNFIWKTVKLKYTETFNKAPVSNAPITLTRDEETISQVRTGGGAVARDTGGKVVRLTSRNDVISYARNNRYNVRAAEDAYEISSQFNGIVGFAKDNTELTQSLADMIGHMKSQLNARANLEDLELVLAIDYSGSMKNNIKSVMEELQVVVESLEAVKATRNVKIGIVTFGEPRREKVNLALTDDLVRVRAKLQELLNRYKDDKHSIEPGEASFYGLNLAADKMGWSSSNRQILLITDEPAYSLRERSDRASHDRFVESVKQKIGAANIYPVVIRVQN